MISSSIYIWSYFHRFVAVSWCSIVRWRRDGGWQKRVSTHGAFLAWWTIERFMLEAMRAHFSLCQPLELLSLDLTLPRSLFRSLSISPMVIFICFSSCSLSWAHTRPVHGALGFLHFAWRDEGKGGDGVLKVWQKRVSTHGGFLAWVPCWELCVLTLYLSATHQAHLSSFRCYMFEPLKFLWHRSISCSIINIEAKYYLHVDLYVVYIFFLISRWWSDSHVGFMCLFVSNCFAGAGQWLQRKECKR